MAENQGYGGGMTSDGKIDLGGIEITAQAAEELGRKRLRAVWEAFGQSVYITLVCAMTQSKHAVQGPQGLLCFVGCLTEPAWQGAIERGILAAEDVFGN